MIFVILGRQTFGADMTVTSPTEDGKHFIMIWTQNTMISVYFVAFGIRHQCMVS